MAVELQNSAAADEEKSPRQEAYEALKSAIHPIYATDFVRNGGKILTIVFSPNWKFMLRSFDFTADVLFIADRKLHYYTHNPGRQCKLLWSFIKGCGYTDVVFLGSSKGGTGALLWASLTSRLAANTNIIALAFSPQVQLYPFNENLRLLPSYVNNMKLVDRNPTHRVNFQTYGDLVQLVGASPLQAIVVFGAKEPMDAVEASRLCWLPNVLLRPISVSFHGSVIPFVTDLTNDDAIAALANKLSKDAASDNDLSATLSQTREEFIKELKSVSCPNLNELIDQSIQRARDGRFI